MFENKRKARMWNYNYAVVQFPADQTYSEIPITWLKEDDSQCWWPPRTSNCPQMIANCESPDCKTWATYKINVVKLCKQDNQSSGFKETWQDVPVINSLSPLLAQQALQQKNDDISHIKRSLQRLLQMQAASNLTLKDIKQRQIKLENAIKSIKPIGLNPLDSDDSLIVELLPLATVNNMKEFDSLLKISNEAVTQFKQFLLKIGGNNPRDNIHRILKKIFTNGCAVNCSWKGVRKNFRLDNLHFHKNDKRTYYFAPYDAHRVRI